MRHALLLPLLATLAVSLAACDSTADGPPHRGPGDPIVSPDGGSAPDAGSTPEEPAPEEPAPEEPAPEEPAPEEPAPEEPAPEEPAPEEPAPEEPAPEEPAPEEPAPEEPAPEEPAPEEPVAPVTPSDPGPSDVRFSVDTTAERRAISAYIYGVNDSNWNVAPANTAFGRFGGNRLTAYNWENNASNAGSDWCHQNDGYLGGGWTAGEAVRQRVASAHAAGASILVTIPMLDYVAADKDGGSASCDGDVINSSNYLQTRFHRNVARKNAPFQFPPDTSDGAVYQDEFVAWLESEFPYARTDPERTIFYSMDNEPALWAHTHNRIHSSGATYQEMVDRTTRFASMVKDVAGESAKVFGPVSFGWGGLTTLKNAPDAGGRDFVEYFLAELAAESQRQGRRLLDVFDFHWYPEARGGDVRVTYDDASPAVAAARIQAPRSLWDATYVEDSWIAQVLGHRPIALLPRFQDKIDRNFPGTRMAVTEYYYGGGAHISGGIAQADVLGIFGRYGVFAANLWHLGSTDDRYIHGAFEMFRDFDGQGGMFGDTSVRADADDAAAASVYAAVDEGNPDRVVIVAINKTGAWQDAGLSVTHAKRLTRAEVYRMTDGNPGPVRQSDLAIDGVNAFTYSMPPYSVSTLVLR